MTQNGEYAALRQRVAEVIAGEIGDGDYALAVADGVLDVIGLEQVGWLVDGWLHTGDVLSEAKAAHGHTPVYRLTRTDRSEAVDGEG